MGYNNIVKMQDVADHNSIMHFSRAIVRQDTTKWEYNTEEDKFTLFFMSVFIRPILVYSLCCAMYATVSEFYLIKSIYT